MGQAKDRGSLEARIQQAQAKYETTSFIDRIKQAQDHTTCSLLALATKNGKPFFQGCAVIGIPNTIGKDEFGQAKWEEHRSDTLGSILWATENKQDPKEILTAIGVYLDTSPTLWTERNYPGLSKQNTCARTGHIHTVDLDNLGCVFEYDISKNPTTTGPRFMPPNEVFKLAREHGLKTFDKESA